MVRFIELVVWFLNQEILKLAIFYEKFSPESDTTNKFYKFKK
jgi:hypothetical protein